MKRGFTIVELLIVIVVIAIIAAISASAYGNISNKAEDAKAIARVRTWEKALASYVSLVGLYPENTTFTSNAAICLDDMPADADFASGMCSLNLDDAFNASYLTPQFVAQGISTPRGTVKTVTFTPTRKVRGAYLKTATDRKTNHTIYYVLHHETCIAGDLVGFESNATGTGITGVQPPGTLGRAKICGRQLPSL